MTVERAAKFEGGRSDAAITAFVGEHYDRLLRLARLVCRDTGDAADAVQMGLEEACRGRSKLRDDARLRPPGKRVTETSAAGRRPRPGGQHRPLRHRWLA